MRFKGLKSPNVPFCLKACTDELLDRMKLGQLRIMPNSLGSLISSAAEARKLDSSRIDDFIETLSTERKLGISSQESGRRITECETTPTYVIFASLWEFISRCKQTLMVNLYYPKHGWIILGPPYSDNYEKIDDSRYQREIYMLLNSVQNELAIRRDMLCCIMAYLSETISFVEESHRDHPYMGVQVRFQLASLFAPMLFSITCEQCHQQLTEEANTCATCMEIEILLQKPYMVDVVDRMLRHLAPQFWTNASTSLHGAQMHNIDSTEFTTK